MKNKVILFATMAVMVLFTACKDDPTTLKLDKTTASVEVGSTITLKATPGSDVTWESSSTSIATVDGGVVTGVSEGSTYIVATSGSQTATCLVTVTKPGVGPIDPTLPPSLQGLEYYIIQLDGVSSAAIQSRIVADFRPDDVTKHLYVWDQTYSDNPTTGLNFYSEPEGWISFKVLSIGWSGFGYAIDDLASLNKLSAVMDNPEAYYFHIAMKSTDQASHLLGLNGTVGEVKFCIGETDFDDAGVIYKPVHGLTRDGEWNEIEIPMTYFTDKGVSFSKNNVEGKNLFWGLSGGTPGVTLQFDACFIYKK